MQSLQSTWYLLPGQTLENTQVSDRGKALVASREGWAHLTQHLQRQERQERQLAEEQARKRYLRDGSYGMTKDWENSLEKIRARRLEEHELKIKNLKEGRMARFMEIKAEQEKDRQQYIKAVKKRLFMQQEKPGKLNSALWTSEVMYERNRQDDFNEQQREHERIEEAKYAQQIFRDAENERLANLEKRRRTRERNVAHRDYLTSQVNDKLGKEKDEHDSCLKHEIMDNKLAVEEYQANKKHEQEKDQRKKNVNKKILFDFREMQERLKEEERRAAMEEEKIADIYRKAKCRIERKTKEKIIEIRASREVLKDNVAKLIMASVEGKEEHEDQMIENARLELEERANQRDKEEAAYKKKLREDRIEDRKRYLAEQEKRKTVQNEIDNFIFLTRLKNAECNAEHQRERKEKQIKKKKTYSKELKDQMADLENVKNREKRIQEEECKYKQKVLEDLDKRYLAYGDEVLSLARDRGRATLPIQAVIEKYKIENGLKPKKKNISHLQSKVPIDADETEEEIVKCDL